MPNRIMKLNGHKLKMLCKEDTPSVERRNYIQKVQTYNQMVRNFPSSIIAQQKGMHVENYYQASSQAQNAPKVDLDK